MTVLVFIMITNFLLILSLGLRCQSERSMNIKVHKTKTVLDKIFITRIQNYRLQLLKHLILFYPIGHLTDLVAFLNISVCMSRFIFTLSSVNNVDISLYLPAHSRSCTHWVFLYMGCSIGLSSPCEGLGMVWNKDNLPSTSVTAVQYIITYTRRRHIHISAYARAFWSWSW